MRMPVLAGALMLLAGCGTSSNIYRTGMRSEPFRPAIVEPPIRQTAESQKREPEASERTKQVQVSGGRIAADPLRGAVLKPEQLLAQAQDLLARRQIQAIRPLVARYPDGIRDLLRAPLPATASPQVLQALAAAYDGIFAPEIPAARMHAWLEGRLAGGDGYDAFDRTLALALRDLAEGRFEAVAASNLPDRAKALAVGAGYAGGAACAEAYRLHASALLVLERTAAAREAIGAAREACGGQPHLDAEMALIEAESARRMGDEPARANAWQAAARALLSVNDPLLWEQALAQRPGSLAWPGAAESSEAWPWQTLGAMRFARNEMQPALLAYSQAEAVSGQDEGAISKARLGQARTLLALRQRGPAQTLLAGLAAGDKGASRAQALALLGALRLEAGEPREAGALLKRALEGFPSAQSGRAQAVADLALCHLMLGDETAGLAGLHQAQQLMAEAGDYEGLVECLSNEFRYAKHVGREKLVQASEQRLELARVKAGLPPSP
ncbi:MAG: hypothetical protein HS116_22370 [Planctomycetes bacterium]|nr:hypothetical protein [Planctomycetota bacterium]